MRPREGQGPLDIPDRERWTRESVEITILGDPAATVDLPRAALFGHIDHDGLRDSFCLVISDEGKVEFQSAGDAALIRRQLGMIATWALDRLTADPDSLLCNGIFRATLFAATTPPARELSRSTVATGLVHIIAVDGESVDDRAQAGENELARALPENPDLARRLVQGAARSDAWSTVDVVADLVGSPASVLRSAQVVVEDIVVTGSWPAAATFPIDSSQPWLFLWNRLAWTLLERAS